MWTLLAVLLILTVAFASCAGPAAQNERETPFATGEDPVTSAPRTEDPPAPALTTTFLPEALPPTPETQTPASTSSSPPAPTTTPQRTTTPAPPLFSSPAPLADWTWWGPATFGKDFPATAGTRIEFADISWGINADGKRAMRVRPVAIGLPENRVYYLWAKKSSETLPEQMTPAGMTVVSDGSVIAIGSTTPVSLELDSYARAEADVIALMAPDRSIIAYGKVVMFPIEARQGNARIWVELLSPVGDLFAVYGAGFEPNEEIEATSDSEGEVLRMKNIADGSGRFTTGILPAVAGKQSGRTTYTVVAKAGTLGLSFDWGPPALRPGP